MNLKSMKLSKAGLLAAAATGVMILAGTAQAFTFATLPGPYVVNATSQSLVLNDALNTAGVPAINYGSATITATWAFGSGDPWSSEATLGFNGGAKVGATSGAANNAVTTLLTWSSLPLGFTYNPSVSAALTIDLRQTYGGGGTTGSWTNITVTLGAAIPPVPAFSGNFIGTPNTIALGQTIAGSTIWTGAEAGLTDGSGQQAQGTRYLGSTFDHVGNEVGYRLEHLGGPLQLDLTGLTTDLDLILLDATGTPAGALARSEGTGSEQIVGDFAAGTYYAVVDTFGSTNAGSNYSLTYIPTPGAASLLAMGGLIAGRRRRA